MLNALWIVLLGMAIIFAVLGILLLVMILLSKLLKPREKQEKRIDNGYGYRRIPRLPQFELASRGDVGYRRCPYMVGNC